jgi:hypothetical protein
MSEATETIDTIEPGSADELQRLRNTNADLLKWKKTNKARIEELETEVAGLTGKLTKAEDNVRELTVNGPLKSLAKAMSKAPGAFLEQFEKQYRVELIDGVLTLLHVADGKPVLNKKGESVPFERKAITELVLQSEGAAKEFYDAIVLVQVGSGTVGTTRNALPESKTQKTVAPNFGLR